MLRCITYISNAKLITGKHYVKLVRVVYFPDALKLATTNELICKWFNSVDFLANMNLANMLSKVELIANDVLQE